MGIIGTYLYLRRSGRFGLLGTVGFYLCVFAFVVVSFLSLGVLLNVWGARWLETLGAAVYELPLLLGLVMFGVAILRACLVRVRVKPFVGSEVGGGPLSESSLC